MATLNSQHRKVYIIVQSSSIHPPGNEHVNSTLRMGMQSGLNPAPDPPLRPVHLITAVHPFRGDVRSSINPRVEHLQHYFLRFTLPAPLPTQTQTTSTPQPQQQSQVQPQQASQPPVLRTHAQQPQQSQAQPPATHRQSQPPAPPAKAQNPLLTQRLAQTHALLHHQRTQLTTLQQQGHHQQHFLLLQQYRQTVRTSEHLHHQYQQQQAQKALLITQLLQQQRYPGRWVIHITCFPTPYEYLRTEPNTQNHSPIFFTLPSAVSVVQRLITDVVRKCEMLYGEVLAVEEFHPLGGKEVWTNRVRGWTYKVIEDLNRHSVGMKEVWYWWDVIEVDVLEMRIG